MWLRNFQAPSAVQHPQKKSQKSQESQLFLRESRRLYIIIILIPYVIIDIYSVKRFSLFFACDICDFVTATNRCRIHGTPTALHEVAAFDFVSSHQNVQVYYCSH